MAENLHNGERVTSRGATVTRVAAVGVALALVSAFVVTGSRAAFTASTTNPGNEWSTGDVVLYDDDGDDPATSRMFSVSNMHPDDPPVVRCIRVSYDGTFDADVTLHAVAGGTGLAPYLDLTVEMGTGGSYADCDGFTGAVISTGTVASFASSYATGAAGLDLFSPSATTPGAPESRTFRFTVGVQSENDALGKTATATFTWLATTKPTS
jgi:hypothetical protein